MFIPELAPWQWVVGAVVAVLVGVAKTGVPGVGTLAVPLMVLAVGDARHSAGWLLPLLCVADLFAVAIYRRHAYARRLLVLLPWVLGGMLAGAVALYAPEALLRPTVAVIVLAMITFHWWNSRAAGQPANSAARTAPAPSALTDLPRAPIDLAHTPVPPVAHTWRQSAVYGGAAGFSTTIANAAGPVMNLYFLAKRLPKDEFVGTGAWFFLVVNLCKVPVYVAHDLIDGRSLMFDLLLVPAVVAGAGVGRVVLRRLRQETFERLVLALTVLACALLFLPKFPGK